MITDFGGKNRIATIDGVLHIAQDMGEADLMFLARFLLPGIAIRYPDIGLMIPQHVFGNVARPARGDFVEHHLVRDKHPLSLGNAVGPRRGFVRGDDLGRQQLIGDCSGGSGHRLARAPKNVGDGALRDGQSEQFCRKARQAHKIALLDGYPYPLRVPNSQGEDVRSYVRDLPAVLTRDPLVDTATATCQASTCQSPNPMRPSRGVARWSALSAPPRARTLLYA